MNSRKHNELELSNTLTEEELVAAFFAQEELVATKLREARPDASFMFSSNKPASKLIEIELDEFTALPPAPRIAIRETQLGSSIFVAFPRYPNPISKRITTTMEAAAQAITQTVSSLATSSSKPKK